jgi:hypothetical protein
MQGFSDACTRTLVLGTHKVQAAFLMLPIYPSLSDLLNARWRKLWNSTCHPYRGFFDFGA